MQRLVKTIVTLIALVIGWSLWVLPQTDCRALLAYTQNHEQAVPSVSLSDLPPEARETLILIKKGGPFPYNKDGVAFGNREKRLPRHPRGYYHEYTVKTPGSRDRGARRIVTGSNGEFYYTDDHYGSFKRIKE